jgi:E3 ubiquitin-protein ligase LRSAM1
MLQQVRLVESQLAALTFIEMDKRKLEIDHNLNDLSEKRIDLSCLLIDLLEQQKQRRAQLLSTLQTLEEFSCNSEDFWLKQYQRLLDKLPEGLSEAQKNIDPMLAQALLLNGVINCLPFLAKMTQCQYDVENITESDLSEAGITNRLDRMHILDAFQMYKKEKASKSPVTPTATALTIEEASAPPLDQVTTMASECAICLDRACEVIFVPCGHFCCCAECPTTLTECPMCRTEIERKIRVVSS